MATSPPSSPAPLDVSAIRTCFPALNRIHNGFPVAYFDGPGGTQVPRSVVETMTDYLYNHNANTHWAYPSSAETDAALEHARRSVSLLLNCSPNEVVFGANMTTLTFHVARSIGRSLKPGDEILVTELDHHANVAPWNALQRDFGVAVSSIRMIPETGTLDWDDLESKLSRHPKVLAIGAASNALGTITDVTTATSLAKKHGAVVFVDAVHLTPHQLPDVKSIGCDFLACSAYKFYGPHVGILYGNAERLSTIDVPKLIPAPDSIPERIETGTLNHEGIVGAGAAVDFLASITNSDDVDRHTTRAKLEASYDALHRSSLPLVDKLWSGLSDIDGIRCYGPPPHNGSSARTPTVSCTMDVVSATDACRQLAAKGLFVSDGDFYAATVTKRLGVDGLIRIGCSCYTTDEEIDRLVNAISDIAQTRR